MIIDKNLQFYNNPKSDLLLKIMSDSDIKDLFVQWNSALQTKDPKKVSALYEENGILIPTLSNKVRHNHEEIEDYFTHFLAKGPVGKINESNIRRYDKTAIHSGLYTFTFEDDTSASARFTFVYRWNGLDWMITEHHSSKLPE